MVKKFEVKEFNSWGKWELNGDGAEALKEAMASGLPFTTGFHGFGKTDYSMSVTRSEDLSYTVTVYGEMDSLYDGSLIYDAVEDGDEELLTDDVISKIIADCESEGFLSDAYVEQMLPEDTDTSDIQEVYYELCNVCQAELEEKFSLVQDITNAWIRR